jgi:serine/threonine-protein kinase
MADQAADDSLVGELVGNCRLEQRIGGGGGGAVYRARHQFLGRHQAVKLSAPDLAGRAAQSREAAAQSRVAHPHVLAIDDSGVWAGRGYLMLPYMPGGSLRHLLARAEGDGQPPQLAPALALAAQAAEGLAAIHRAGLIHNDICPANMLLGRELGGAAQLKIGDFGLARPSGEPPDASRAGTPRYMAPERFIGQQVDQRSDIYSLGLALYALLTGQPAFRPRSMHEAAYAQLHQTPPAPRRLRPELAADLEELLLGCLAKRPAERPPAASGIAEALRRMGQRLLA